MTWLPLGDVPPGKVRSARDLRRRGPVHTGLPQHVRRPRRAWASVGRRTGLVALAAILFVGTWVGVRAWAAKAELERAQELIFALKDEVAAGEYGGAVDEYDAVREHTAAARALTDDPLWRLAEQAPFLGGNLSSFREITGIVDDAMIAAAPLVDLAATLDPSTLAPQDGAIPMEPIVTASTEVPVAARAFAVLAERLADVPTDHTLGQLRDAKTKLSGVLNDAASALSDAVPLTSELPRILGAEGTRTYVVMFLNNAELRSLGGTALSFAEVTIDNGKIALTRQVPAAMRNFPHRDLPVIPVSEGFDNIYPMALGRFVANATFRPSAETAAEIVRAEWEDKFGVPVDGVVSMDIGALSALLKATDPIPLSTGDVVDADNVASLLLNTVYARYNSGDMSADNLSQNAVYAETLTQTFARLSSGQFDPVTLYSSMGTAAEEGHFSVWLTDESERTVLAGTGVAAGGLPVSTDSEDVVGVYLNDQLGAKLNYYLGSQITSGSAQCTSDGRQVHRVTLTLSNLLPPESVADLSPSISGTSYESLGVEKGEQRLLVLFYLPPGATLLSTQSADLDSVQIDVRPQSDDDHPVQSVWMTIPPGGTSEVTVDVLMGTPGQRSLVTDVTPTVRGVGRETAPLACDTVALP